MAGSSILSDPEASVTRGAGGGLMLITMWVGENLAKCRDKIRDLAASEETLDLCRNSLEA